jgi:cytochrome c553
MAKGPSVLVHASLRAWRRTKPTPTRACRATTFGGSQSKGSDLKRRLMWCMALALLPAAMQAQTTVDVETTGELKAALALTGDPVRGKAAFDRCTACHRKDASGRTNGATPRLSGQHASVIVKQVADIRSGQRSNPPMKPYVEPSELTLQALADIATYLQALPVVGNVGQGSGNDLARAKAMYERDCAGCHGEQGEGRATLFHPMLAAQHYGYLLHELGLIRDGVRGNSNPVMRAIVQGYAPADLQAVADHLSRLPPPK